MSIKRRKRAFDTSPGNAFPLIFGCATCSKRRRTASMTLHQNLREPRMALLVARWPDRLLRTIETGIALKLSGARFKRKPLASSNPSSGNGINRQEGRIAWGTISLMCIGDECDNGRRSFLRGAATLLGLRLRGRILRSQTSTRARSRGCLTTRRSRTAR
jgi:hypothetical protein